MKLTKQLSTTTKLKQSNRIMIFKDKMQKKVFSIFSKEERLSRFHVLKDSLWVMFLLSYWNFLNFSRFLPLIGSKSFKDFFSKKNEFNFMENNFNVSFHLLERGEKMETFPDRGDFPTTFKQPVHAPLILPKKELHLV